jgi:glycine/D-amino acid oxidase-like deaminating enzyme
MARKPLRVVVVGAGAFGGWTALALLRRGARVTLLDAWGPGHSRASSGGETRIIRAGYGHRAVYTRLAARALELWRAHDRRYGRSFFRQNGAVWLTGADAEFGRDTIATLQSEAVRFDKLTPREARRRYPQIDFSGISTVIVEPDAGYLLARRACEHVVECVVAEGGEYRTAAAASPQRFDGARAAALRLVDKTSISADVFVFTCGPWLGSLFPDVVGRRVTPTKQDVFYFGTPAGDTRFDDTSLPVWIDVGDRLMYGIPGNAHRGFKIADDTPGPRFDPTNGTRAHAGASLRRVRSYLRRRFPALAGAPLTGVEVCQYEATPDSHYILDRHPAADNVWIVGGGSGHGFKMGPALGEDVAACVVGDAVPDPTFALRRRQASPKWAS